MVSSNHKKGFKNSVIGLALFVAILQPNPTHAGVFSDFTGKVRAIFLPGSLDQTEVSPTTQNMSVMRPVVVDDEDLNGAILDETPSADLLSATSGSLRVSTEQIDFPTNDTISVYEVKKGDNLSTVAKLFGVSKNTIIWANDLKSESLTPGSTLVILPMTGIKHTIKKGDTLSSIAKKYKADAADIGKFNGLSPDDDLAVGDTILVPEGEITVTVTKKTSSGKVVVTGKLLDSYNSSAPEGFFVRPLIGGRKTQGLHGHNGVDYGAPMGSPVVASASGRVILAKVGGYNGGYGNMIIIAHDGGIQTVYAHLSKVNVVTGQSVSQGQTIGTVGNTGKSTGPHLHFEVRGAKNPF